MGKKRILVIEDDNTILEVIGLVLDYEGYHVISMRNHQELLRSDLSDIADLIMLDHQLAGITGHDICIDLKKDEQTRSIPVILMSASDVLQDIAASCGADGFIAKPFDIDGLTACVRRLVK